MGRIREAQISETRLGKVACSDDLKACTIQEPLATSPSAHWTVEQWRELC
jgi:hypothetical protein